MTYLVVLWVKVIPEPWEPINKKHNRGTITTEWMSATFTKQINYILTKKSQKKSQFNIKWEVSRTVALFWGCSALLLYKSSTHHEPINFWKCQFDWTISFFCEINLFAMSSNAFIIVQSNDHEFTCDAQIACHRRSSIYSYSNNLHVSRHK